MKPFASACRAMRAVLRTSTPTAGSKPTCSQVRPSRSHAPRMPRTLCVSTIGISSACSSANSTGARRLSDPFATRTGALPARRADGSLRTLTVEGFGLIDRTCVDLGPGLNVFTGETGSGKSMVIDAIGFAFGARAGADVVRAGSDKARVHVEVEPNSAARHWADENGFASDEGEPLVIAREMQAQGRSSARINGRPATAAQLRELGDILLDVVGQHEHTRLVRPALHRETLDAFGGEAALKALEAVRSLHS